MVEREIACEFYEYEHSCKKGKEGTFRKACQICKKYKPKKAGLPARKNLKKQKTEKIRMQDMEEMMKEYDR